MKNKDIKQILINLVFGIIGGVLTYLVNFLLTPYITNTIGIEAYGFVSLGNTLISYINIVSVSINAFAARHIAVHYHNSRLEKANKIYSSILCADIILSGVTIIICTILINKLETFLSIPDKIVPDVKLLFSFILLNYLINIFSGVISSIAFINNKISITSSIKAIASILYLISIMCLLLLTEFKLFYVGMGNFIACFTCFWLTYVASKKIDCRIKFEIRNCSFSTIKEIISTGIYNSINSLGGTLGSGLDLLISNKYLSSIVMGQVAVGSQIGTLVTIAISLISGIFQPKQLEAYSKNNITSLVKQLRLSMIICGFVGLSFYVQFLTLGKQFLLYWLPNQDIDVIYNITLIILLGNTFVAIATPLYYVMTLTLKMRIVSVITVICGFINLVLMLFFVNIKIDYGPYIIVGSTTLLNLVALFIFPYLSNKFLNINTTVFCYTISKYILFLVLLTITVINFNNNYSKYFSFIDLLIISILLEIILLIFYCLLMLSNDVLLFIVAKFKKV